MSNRSFHDLTRRARLYRFRQLAEGALAAYGLEGADLHFLQYGENVIYRVDLSHASEQINQEPDDPSDRFLLRLHAWDEPDYIASEMIWLEALANSPGLPVQKPIRTLDGELLTKVSTPDLPQGRWATLLSWLPGRKMNKGLRPKHLQALGCLVARLHSFSVNWQPPEGFTRPKWDWNAQLGGSLFEVDREELICTMPSHFQEPFRILSREAQQVMSQLGESPEVFGLIHADLYPENVLYSAGQAYPIDFEDCGYSYWIWDIGVALCTWAWNESWEPMRDAFYEGYTAIRPLPEAQWCLLDLFIATQYGTMLLWASAFLARDPERAGEYVPWRDESGQRLLKYFDRH
jgi:Ser/Thr protein kinase RdoA (MazF antagonist)